MIAALRLHFGPPRSVQSSLMWSLRSPPPAAAPPPPPRSCSGRGRGRTAHVDDNNDPTNINGTVRPHHCDHSARMFVSRRRDSDLGGCHLTCPSATRPNLDSVHGIGAVLVGPERLSVKRGWRGIWRARASSVCCMRPLCCGAQVVDL